jgi:DNA-binding NtrC family response regulator
VKEASRGLVCEQLAMNRVKPRALSEMVRSKSPKSPVVLVVDDEEIVRGNAVEMLRADGYEVIDAPDAAAALRLLEERSDVKVLFTDVNMPGHLDGLQLARDVHERWPNVLLLITSGHDMLREADIPDDGRFLAKPYRLSALSGQVCHLLGTHQQE